MDNRNIKLKSYHSDMLSCYFLIDTVKVSSKEQNCSFSAKATKYAFTFFILKSIY